MQSLAQIAQSYAQSYIQTLNILNVRFIPDSSSSIALLSQLFSQISSTHMVNLIHIPSDNSGKDWEEQGRSRLLPPEPHPLNEQ